MKRNIYICVCDTYERKENTDANEHLCIKSKLFTKKNIDNTAIILSEFNELIQVNPNRKCNHGNPY